jgi:hypothetical protein
MNDELGGSRQKAIHLRYTLSSRDVARASRGQIIRAPLFWLVSTTLGVVSLLRLISDPFDPNPFVLLVIGLLLFLVVAPAGTALLSRGQLGSQELAIDDSGILLKTATAESHEDWRSITSVRDVGGVYVLRRGWQGGTLIPRRAFDDPTSEQTFRAMCAGRSKTRFA